MESRNWFIVEEERESEREEEFLKEIVAIELNKLDEMSKPKSNF